MENVSMEHSNTQEQAKLLKELVDSGLTSQHHLTTSEICDAMENSQIKTCQNIIQIVLEDRRRIRREELSQSVKNSLNMRKSQLATK